MVRSDLLVLENVAIPCLTLPQGRNRPTPYPLSELRRSFRGQVFSGHSRSMHRPCLSVDTLHVLYLSGAVVVDASHVGVRQLQPHHFRPTLLRRSLHQDGQFCPVEMVHGCVGPRLRTCCVIVVVVVVELTLYSHNRVHHDPFRSIGLVLLPRQPSQSKISVARRPRESHPPDQGEPFWHRAQAL